jgi:hypothetical protein
MRLPGRFLVFACGFLATAASIAQAPPPPPPPQREVPGGTLVVAPQTETITESPAVSLVQAPQPLGFESDVNCFGYVGRATESFTGTIIGAENLAEQTDFTTTDLLYVNGGYDRGLKVGDEFWLITPDQMVVHPLTGKDLGRFYQYRGRGVIDSVEGRTSTLRVTNACTDIPMGSVLKPFEPIPIPLARKTPPAVAGDPPSGKARGRIVFTRDGVVAVGADSTVIVDLGAAEGLEPGDFLTIYRYATGVEYGIRPVGAYWVHVPPPPGVVVPRTYLGEIGILAVGDRWAIGRVTDSYRMIAVGDEVELK